jgi:hypothetical protein
MRPSAIASIVNEIGLKGRRTVVELGAGTSTLFLARAVRESGGTVLSVEHDREFAAYITRLLLQHGLADTASVATVGMRPLPPDVLEPVPGWRLPATWYDIEDLLAACPTSVDTLVVDGPPGGDQPDVLVRAPAVPVLRDRLAPAYSIFIDDADRPAERQTLRQWGESLGIETVIVERIALGMGNSDGGISPTY